MKSALRARLVRLLAGTLLASSAGLLIAPGAAEAGCPSHERPAVALPDFAGAGLAAADRGGGSSPGDASGQPGRPRPCNGPSCSGRPALPVSPAPPAVPRLGPWAILDPAPAVAAPGQAAPREDEGRISPIRLARSIFHPPRPAASPQP